MKAILGTLIPILISTTAMAAAQLTREEPLWDVANDPSLDGTWNLAERTCGVGRGSKLIRMEPYGQRYIKTDGLRLTIKNGLVGVEGDAEAFELIRMGLVQREKHVVESIRGRNRQIVYRFEPDGSLTFIADGDGSCHGIADLPRTLFINFIRN